MMNALDMLWLSLRSEATTDEVDKSLKKLSDPEIAELLGMLQVLCFCLPNLKKARVVMKTPMTEANTVSTLAVTPEVDLTTKEAPAADPPSPENEQFPNDVVSNQAPSGPVQRSVWPDTWQTSEGDDNTGWSGGSRVHKSGNKY